MYWYGGLSVSIVMYFVVEVGVAVASGVGVALVTVGLYVGTVMGILLHATHPRDEAETSRAAIRMIIFFKVSPRMEDLQAY